MTNNNPIAETVAELAAERDPAARVPGLAEAMARVPTDTLGEFLSRKLGTRNWVLAPRLTTRLRDRGYDLAISRKRYAELEREWEVATYGAPLESLRDAAPDLLAALHVIRGESAAAIMRHGRPGGADPALSIIYEMARAAIAKAEG